jgi:hypothetical protein
VYLEGTLCSKLLLAMSRLPFYIPRNCNFIFY